MEHPILTTENIQYLHHRIDQLEREKTELQHLLQEEITINQLRTDFLAKASHDLRSPLTSIQLSASLVKHYYHRLDEDRIFGHLEKIKEAVSHFVVVLNHYLISEQDDSATEDRSTT